jgi:hypothetical protein
MYEKGNSRNEECYTTATQLRSSIKETVGRSHWPRSELRFRTSTERQLRPGVGKSLDTKMFIRVAKGFAVSTLPEPGIYVTNYMRVMFKN